MVRIFADFFFHSHASLKQLHDRTLLDLRQRVIGIADKWQQKIQAMPIEELPEMKSGPKHLEKVARDNKKKKTWAPNTIKKNIGADNKGTNKSKKNTTGKK